MLTEKLTPVLEKSKLPKLIIVSSGAGSIQRVLERKDMPPPLFLHGSSKASVNHLMAMYTRKFPRWKVNAVCPGARATKINKLEMSENTDPALGAVRVMELVNEGLDGVTGTYSNMEGPLPF
jgi:NAD(P)-dependent dehydrogenase (short-subunit alcohol dehydrogenase family)